jgi:flavin-dependent dehydrogenase
MAVGDAAFAPDPLSGMGIEFAIESAQLAAEALLASTRDRALADYEETILAYAGQHERARAFFRAREWPSVVQEIEPLPGPLN